MAEFVLPTIDDLLSERLVEYLPAPTSLGALLLFVWFAWLAVLYHVCPGRTQLGQKLKDGTQILYPINGLNSFIVTIAAYLFASFKLELFSPTIIYDNLGGVSFWCLVFVVFFSIYLYVSASILKLYDEEEITNNFLMDFWLGIELNPRLFGMDLKLYALRPAMMGWAIINVSVASEQYLKYGTLSISMVIYQLLSGFYVADYFWFEEKMLSTWDIIAEHWGFMLVFGDLWFIPFVFSVQSFYLVDTVDDLPTNIHIALSLGIFSLGYAIFRVSNLQKDQFKHNPKLPIWGETPRTIKGKLFVSGMWGLMRKPNYTGDILIALGFSVPCGTSNMIPWIYPTYLTLLLIHRAYRDHKKCSAKYGPLWEEYMEQVPYLFIPGIL